MSGYTYKCAVCGQDDRNADGTCTAGCAASGRLTTNDRNDGMVVISGWANIHAARAMSLRSRLGLEIKGLRFNGRPTAVIIREMGISSARSRAKVYADLDAYIVALGGPTRPLCPLDGV